MAHDQPSSQNMLIVELTPQTENMLHTRFMIDWMEAYHWKDKE